MGDAPYEGIVRVAVSQEGTDGEEDLGDGQGWTPVVLQDVQTDRAVAVDVAVVDPRAETHLNTPIRHGDVATVMITKSLRLILLKVPALCKNFVQKLHFLVNA